jgi:hypothetical protein
MIAVTCDRVRELASGFVLGALDTDEMIAVAAHLDACSEEHPEVYEFGGVVPYLAESLEPVEPPSWLRESVIAAAKADLSARRRAAVAAEPPTIEPVALPIPVAAALAPSGITSIEVARVSRRRRAMTWSMRAAAAVAILVLTGTGIVVQGNLAKALKAQQEDTTLNYALTQHDTRSAVMAATAGSKAGGIAALLPTGHIILKLYGLTPTKNDEVYTAWISVDKGGPTKVGSFTPDDNGIGYLEVDNVPTSPSLWLYVSKESNAKVTLPTGPIIVSGVVNL